MSSFFLPSLQHIAAVKVALAVYNDDILHMREENLQMIYNFFGHSLHSNILQKERIRERKNEIRTQLSTTLPASLVEQVVHILQPIVVEVLYWIRDHFHIFEYIKSHMANNLCWKSDGTIDRAKTSKKLIGNENIDKGVRFILACIYFYEQDVLQLWESMIEDERENISSIDDFLAVKFWTKCLKKDAAPWTQWIDEYLSFDPQEQITGFKYLRISSFYKELNSFYKKNLLHTLWPRHTHVKDLLICYNLTDETERDEIFHNPHSYESKTKHLLCFYLDWPLQPLFLDVVNQMWDHLTAESFDHFFRYIMYQKLLECMEDFDYLHLFKELWKRIPNGYKEEIRKKNAFTVFEKVLSFDENTSSLLFMEKLQDSKRMIIMLLIEDLK